MYGVSPHPRQALEYSNSGSRNCELLWSIRFISVRLTSGRSRKKL